MTKKYQFLVLLLFISLSIILCAKNSPAKSGPSEIEEYYRTEMTGYYDVEIGAERNEKNFKKAVMSAKKEFEKTLKEICLKNQVKYKILVKEGPHQINYKQHLSYEVLLTGENIAITEVDRFILLKYHGEPWTNNPNEI